MTFTNGLRERLLARPSRTTGEQNGHSNTRSGPIPTALRKLMIGWGGLAAELLRARKRRQRQIQGAVGTTVNTHVDMDETEAQIGGQDRLEPDAVLTLKPYDLPANLAEGGRCGVLSTLLNRFPEKVLQDTPTLPPGKGGLLIAQEVVATVLAGGGAIHDLIHRATRRAFDGSGNSKLIVSILSLGGTFGRMSLREALSVATWLRQQGNDRLNYAVIVGNDDGTTNPVRSRAVVLSGLTELESLLGGSTKEQAEAFVAGMGVPSAIERPHVVFYVEPSPSYSRQRFVGSVSAFLEELGTPAMEQALNRLANGMHQAELRGLNLTIPSRAEIVWMPAEAAKIAEALYATLLCPSSGANPGSSPEDRAELQARVAHGLRHSPAELLSTLELPVDTRAAKAFHRAYGLAQATTSRSVFSTQATLARAVDHELPNLAEDVERAVQAAVDRRMSEVFGPINRLAASESREAIVGDTTSLVGCAMAARSGLEQWQSNGRRELDAYKAELETLEGTLHEARRGSATQEPGADVILGPSQVLGRMLGFLRRDVNPPVNVRPQEMSPEQSLRRHADQLELYVTVYARIVGIRAADEAADRWLEECRKVEAGGTALADACVPAATGFDSRLAQTEAAAVARKPEAAGLFLPLNTTVLETLVNQFAPAAQIARDRAAVVQDVTRGWQLPGEAITTEAIVESVTRRAHELLGSIATMRIDELFAILPGELIARFGEELYTLAVPLADVSDVAFMGKQLRLLGVPGGSASPTWCRLQESATLRDPEIYDSPYNSPECQVIVYTTLASGVEIRHLARTPERMQAFSECAPEDLWSDHRLARNPVVQQGDIDQVIALGMACKAVLPSQWLRRPPKASHSYYAVPLGLWDDFQPRIHHRSCEWKETSIANVRQRLSQQPDSLQRLEDRIAQFKSDHGEPALIEAVATILSAGRYPNAELASAARSWLERHGGRRS